MVNVLFLALKRLSSRASRRALAMTPLPVRVFVFEPDAKVRIEGLPLLVAREEDILLPGSTRMPPILGSRGTVFASTTLDVCLARSFLMPSMAALRASASWSTALSFSTLSFL